MKPRRDFIFFFREALLRKARRASNARRAGISGGNDSVNRPNHFSKQKSGRISPDGRQRKAS